MERDGADWVVDFDIALLYSVSTRDGPIHYPHARQANIVLVEVPIWLSVIYHLHYWTKTVSHAFMV